MKNIKQLTQYIVNKLLYRKNMILSVIIIINISIVYIAYFLTRISIGDKIFLISDGYYEYAKYWVETGNIKNSVIAPGVPAILTSLFLFPEPFHPVLRVTISLIFSVAVIILAYKITKDFLTPTAFLAGSLIFILNISWIHWILKLTPEVFLSAFLGIYILFTFKYIETRSWIYILCSNLVFAISIMFKPVLLVIPFFLLLYSFFKKNIVIYSLINVIVALISFEVYTNLTTFAVSEISSNRSEGYNSVIRGGFIRDSFWYDFMIRTGQFHKGMKEEYKEGSFYDTGYKKGDDFINDYFRKNPDSGFLMLNLNFIIKHPWLAFQKILIGPFFYLILGTTMLHTIILTFLTILSLTLMTLGIRKISRLADAVQKENLIILFLILLGFSTPYLVFHAYSRYSMPILPYLYVWAGGILYYFPKLAIKNGRLLIKNTNNI